MHARKGRYGLSSCQDSQELRARLFKPGVWTHGSHRKRSRLLSSLVEKLRIHLDNVTRCREFQVRIAQHAGHFSCKMTVLITFM